MKKPIREMLREERDFYILVFAMFIGTLAGPTVFVVLPLYFRNLGLTTAEIGIIVSLNGIGGIFAGLIAGKLSDMVGRKPVTVAGWICYLIPCLILLLSKEKIFFYIALTLIGVATQMFLTAQYAFIADVFPPERRGGAFGLYQSIAIGMSTMIGQVLFVGYIYNVLGAGVYFILLASCHVIAGLIVLFFVKEKKRHDTKQVNIAEIPATNLRTFKRFNFKLSNPHFSRLFIIFMVASIVRSLYQMAQPIFPIFLSNLGISVSEVSIIYSSASIVSMITPIIFGKLSDKFGRKKLLILGTLIAGIYALQGFWTLTFSQALTMKLFDALSLAIITPISLAFLTELLPPSQKGLGIGLYNSILRLDSSALGAVGGILVQLYGFNVLFLVGIVASIISSVIILIYIPEKHKILES